MHRIIPDFNHLASVDIATSTRPLAGKSEHKGKSPQFTIIFRSITTVYLIRLIGSSAELSIQFSEKIESPMNNKMLRMAMEKDEREEDRNRPHESLGGIFRLGRVSQQLT